jgi:hypothetical protein
MIDFRVWRRMGIEEKKEGHPTCYSEGETPIVPGEPYTYAPGVLKGLSMVGSAHYFPDAPSHIRRR